MAVKPGAIDAYEDWLLPRLNDDTHSWRSIEDGDSPLSRSLNRAEAMMLALSGTGATGGSAAQRYCQRNHDVVAIFKTLGADKKQIRRIFLLHLLLLTAGGGGLALGWAIQYVVIERVAQKLDATLLKRMAALRIIERQVLSVRLCLPCTHCLAGLDSSFACIASSANSG